MRKSMIAQAAVLAAMLIVTACNTVEGVGKDVKSAGEAVEKAAQ